MHTSDHMGGTIDDLLDNIDLNNIYANTALMITRYSNFVEVQTY